MRNRPPYRPTPTATLTSMASIATRVNKESSRPYSTGPTSSVTTVTVRDTRGKATPPPAEARPLASPEDRRETQR